MLISEAHAKKSWEDVISSYEEFLTTVNGKNLGWMLALARNVSKSTFADRLLASTSVARLAIRKDAEWWDVPHVLVTQLGDGNVLCELWRKQTGSDILVSHQCPQTDAEKVVFELISRLLALDNRS